jgi:hypothetical protein
MQFYVQNPQGFELFFFGNFANFYYKILFWFLAIIFDNVDFISKNTFTVCVPLNWNNLPKVRKKQLLAA